MLILGLIVMFILAFAANWRWCGSDFVDRPRIESRNGVIRVRHSESFLKASPPKPITAGKNMEQKPSVCRLVHYFEEPDSAPVAAMITHVYVDDEFDCVDLTVFPRLGPVYTLAAVPFQLKHVPDFKGRAYWPARQS